MMIIKKKMVTEKMLLKEFVDKANMDQMIAILIKYHGVGSVKVKMKSMKDHAHYDVDRGELQLSTRYSRLKDSQLKEFLITIIHEIYHAIDAKKYGWKKFKEMYEMEMNLQVQQGKDEYDDNKYEIAAEEFGQKNWKKWYNKFKKQGLI